MSSISTESTQPLVPQPRLKTALQNAPLALEQHFLNRKDDIEIWLRKAFRLSHAPFYSSVDIRNAGYKIAPVDTNLYPAGFNNLHPDLKSLSVNAIQVAISRTCPETDNVIIIPENHTRNLRYFDHLHTLQDLIRMAGFPVRIMSINPEITDIMQIKSSSGEILEIYPLDRRGKFLHFDEQIPCAVVLNNDLSGGLPESLIGLKQNMIPTSDLGWYQRQKSNHFDHYRNIVMDFSKDFNIDPWALLPHHETIRIDFQTHEGEAQLEQAVSRIFAKIQDEYDKRGVEQEPFVAIKSNNGTYGMGIIMAKSPDEVLSLNRKQRKKLAANKEGLMVDELLIQEGVYAMETIENAIAEPVVYMIDQFVVGSFYRVHNGKTASDNLNSPGMYFDPLPVENPCSHPPCKDDDDTINRFYAYSVVARLANLAASYELTETMET